METEIRPYVIEKLERIFNPKSIAVVGASRHPEKIGYRCLRNLIEGGFEGDIFPVNPNAREIFGIECYSDLSKVPQPVDLALIVLPAEMCEKAIKSCIEKLVNGIAVVSSGFSEVGKKNLEERIANLCRKNKIPLIGPNIIGVLSNTSHCNASFAQSLPYPGHLTFISQSGALGIALIGRTWIDKIGLSKLVSIGNQADVDFAELISYFAEKDEDTHAICLYMEGLPKGKRFVEACKKASKIKPLIALKVGNSEKGSMAVQSHTGSMAGQGAVYKGAFKQAGVIEAIDLGDLFDKALALSLQPPLKGDGVAVITNGGGAGVCATDAAELCNIPLKNPPASLKARMREWIPEFGSTKNPFDITGQALKENYEGTAIDALEHQWVDGAVILYCQVAQTAPQEVADGIYHAVHSYRGPKKPVTVALLGGIKCEEAALWLKERNIPTYPTPERAVSALSALREFGRVSQ
ncbi:MAG TPA: acetyl CoA synthetase [Thermoplasmata archaeon]|nr:acetyl CoA synthetase [Thermoplasmata archaeon]